MMSGRLVAATRNTPARPSAPSISVSSWFTTLRTHHHPNLVVAPLGIHMPPQSVFQPVF